MNAPLTTTSDRWTAWHLAAAALLACAGVLATWDAWEDIFHIATVDEENSHIFLVPVVAVWMVWVRRARFRHTKPVGTLLGPLMAGLGWMVASYGYYHKYQSLWHGGSVLVVLGCALAVLGRQVFFRFFPAILVLGFLVPVPGVLRLQIAQPLQVWTSQVSEVALTMIGQDVERSGNALTVNGRAVNVVEACNGMRMVFALALVSYAFSFGLPLRNWVRILVLLASPIAAIFCNVVRVLPTVWLYGFDDQYWGEFFHNYSGWLMLPVAFLILLGIIKALQWAMIPVMRYTLASQEQV